MDLPIQSISDRPQSDSQPHIPILLLCQFNLRTQHKKDMINYYIWHLRTCSGIHEPLIHIIIHAIFLESQPIPRAPLN